MHIDTAQDIYHLHMCALPDESLYFMLSTKDFIMVCFKCQKNTKLFAVIILLSVLSIFFRLNFVLQMIVFVGILKTVCFEKLWNMQINMYSS